jgi:hypothetical protein
MQGKREIGRVTYIVKAKNKRQARAKITQLMKARKPAKHVKKAKNRKRAKKSKR